MARALVPAGEREDRLLYGLGLCLFTVLSLLLAVYRERLAGWDETALYRLALLLFAAAALCLVVVSRRGIWSFSSIFLCVYALFHLGIVLMLALGIELPLRFTAYVNRWWHRFDNHYAIVLVLVGLTALVVGVCAAHLLFPRPARRAGEPAGLAELLPRVGLGMICVCVGIFFGNLLWRGGFSLLLGSYASYIEASDTFLSGYHFYFNGLGLIFLAISPPSRYRRAGIALYLVFAAVALPMGLRGRVFFPMLVALAAAAMKRPPLSTARTLVFGLCLLSAISVFKQVRQVGLGDVRVTELTFLPSEGLAELGGSLRPVTEVVAQTSKGEDFLWGASYWAPFDRSLVYLVPGWTRPPVAEDERFVAVRMSERVGPIGYSMVAEAYRNFGVLGVTLFLLGVGGLIGRFEQWPATLLHQMRAGAILSPLLLEVRNAFIFVPSSMLIGLTTVFVLSRIAALRGEAGAPAVRQAGLWGRQEGG